MEIVNAKITSTFLGKDGHGVLTFRVYMNLANAARSVGGSIGGYALEGRDLKHNCYAYSAKGTEAIAKILDTVDVNSWEDLEGSYLRVKYNDKESTIDEIGNLMSEKWFNLKKFFSSEEDT